MRAILPLLVFASACAPSVIPAFEAARDQALADPGPAPAAWRPDAIVTMSPVLVDLALRQLLESQAQVVGTLDVGLLRATPTVTVERVSLGDATCDRCLSVDAGLRGSLAVSTPLGSIAAPLRADLSFDAEFEVLELDGSWTVTLAPREVRTVDVRVGGTDLSALTGPVVGWLTDALAGHRVPVADLGSASLPLRAMRVRPLGEGLRLELLTDTPAPVAVPDPDLVPESGWRLDLATDALVDLARATSLGAEPGPHGIVAEPTALFASGDRFVLNLRLWRVVGRGWWRDYVVHGTLAVRDGAIVLTPDQVEDAGHSPGAAWTDPMAGLAHGRILRTVERALETSVPAVHDTTGQPLPVLEVRIEELRGLGTVIVGHGAMVLGQP